MIIKMDAKNQSTLGMKRHSQLNSRICYSQLTLGEWNVYQIAFEKNGVYNTDFYSFQIQLFCQIQVCR